MEGNCDLSNSRGSFIIRHPILFHCTVIGVILVVFLCVSSLVILSKCLIPNRKILLKVPSPPVPEPKHAGIKLDTDSARAALVDVMRFPQELEDYNKWIKISDANAKRMSHVCEIATDALIYYLHNRDTAHGKNALTSAQELYVRISKRFDAHFNLKSRVSPRWYPSDFTITTFLAMYLLIPDTSSKDGAAKLVLDLIKKPNNLFSHSVSIHDSPMLVGPWLLAHEQLGTLDEALKNSSYHLILKYLDFDIVTDHESSGLHRDLSFLRDAQDVYYTNLWRMCRNNYAYTFLLTQDLRKRSPMRLWNRITRTIYHERIPITMLNLSTKTNKQATEVYPGTMWGLHVMPFCKILRYFTKDVNFMVRGRENDLPARTNANSRPMGYWTQLRQIFHREDDPEGTLKYLSTGFITDADDNQSSKMSRKLRSRPVFRALGFSCVFQYMNYGVLYQRLKHDNYAQLTSQELIFIDELEKNFTIYMQFLNLSPPKSNLMFYRTSTHAGIMIKSLGMAVLKTTYNFHTKEYNTETIPSDTYDLHKEISKRTNDKLTMQMLKDNRGAVVYHEGKPIIYAPSLLENETEEVTITSDSYATGVFPTATFKFNKDLNQYCSEFA
ncbi:odv-e66-4 [Fopius arisanus]|nr:odv-e66-4 [Fopius arisanus]